MRITPSLIIDEKEIKEQFIRSSGPGGQNVNKVATAVQLRFNVRHNNSLPDDVRKRLMRLAGNRITEEGDLIIEARRYRTQERNRQDARERLVSLVQKATIKPKIRLKTKPSASSIKQRLEEKQRRGKLKQLRRQSDYFE
jgi:ribosome-associated protein